MAIVLLGRHSLGVVASLVHCDEHYWLHYHYRNWLPNDCVHTRKFESISHVKEASGRNQQTVDIEFACSGNTFPFNLVRSNSILSPPFTLSKILF